MIDCTEQQVLAPVYFAAVACQCVAHRCGHDAEPGSRLCGRCGQTPDEWCAKRQQSIARHNPLINGTLVLGLL
ncbi:hypothetical protein [Candidatus Poriferisodalis sp.]|uniref:hypothetical protein n=1 Tax=Candidatus Poriferisodalis sp. TaxID=3101277 RepID=UPI003B019586